MKKPFEIGERIKVFTADLADSYRERKAWVTGFRKDKGLLEVAYRKDRSVCGYAHPKQCRRLVKKKRREIWLHPQYETFPPVEPLCEHRIEGWLKFIEAK